MFNQHNEAPIHLILVVLALVLFFLASTPFAWAPPYEVHRTKLIAAGLFFLTLATFF